MIATLKFETKIKNIMSSVDAFLLQVYVMLFSLSSMIRNSYTKRTLKNKKEIILIFEQSVRADYIFQKFYI